jgi:hypothetical protein
MIISRHPDRKSYDFSKKPFEIVCKFYNFDKYKRILLGEPVWQHKKYYQTMEAARDAVKVFRENAKLENISPESEPKYPHIKPRITLMRFAIIKRTF